MYVPYFPSYTLGAINAAQIFRAITVDHPHWKESLKKGDITFIRQWLQTKIWDKASSMESQDIISGATGEKTNPDVFLTHLRNRYIGN